MVATKPEESTDEARARQIVAAIQARLVAVVTNRPFRFVNSSRSAAMAHLARMVEFRGSSAAELEAHERVLGGRLPLVYRAYVLAMGARHGQLFCESQVDFERRAELRAAAERMDDRRATVPANAELFRVHQGYSCSYILAAGGFDGPVYTFECDDECAHVECESFAELLDREVSMMEDTARRWKESGGYIVEVRADGTTTQTFGGRAGLPRPLDLPDQFRSGLWERLRRRKPSPP